MVAMIKSLLFILGIFVFTANAQGFAQNPASIAGFVLGGNIADYKDKVKMETALPIRHMEYLTEVEVIAAEGFKSGLISYGNCEKAGQVVKISMKYDNCEKAFYDELLVRFKKRFGEPTEWRGDPFHVYVAWKWSFRDKSNNRISMILQHYSGDDDEYKKGNSVKLSATTLIEKEGRCFASKHPEAEDDGAAQSGKKASGKAEEDYQKIDFGRLIPN